MIKGMVKMADTALVVVDLVRDFTEPEGSIYYPTTGNMMPRVCNLINDLRERGVLIVYIQNVADERRSKNKHIKTRASCVKGSGGELLDKRLSVFEQDKIVIKNRFSAFFKTTLEDVLQSNGVKKVIVIGTKTNCCVRATAIDSNMRDYDTYIVSDCVSTNTDELNKFHLEDLAKYTAKVLTADELIRSIDSGLWEVGGIEKI